jgi:hypothetical protein
VTPVRVARLACAIAACLAAAPAAAAPPRCRVAVDLSPARAYVGEQVHYRIRILRRRDVSALEWHTALSFPTFRAEWLPGVASDSPLAQEGESWLEFLERRAVFPAHPGRLEIPEAALRCATVDGEEIVPVPSQALDVDPLPSEGQPAAFSGLLGPIELAATVDATRIALGETLRLVVALEGATNVWVAPSPRAALEAVPDLDVFEQSAQLARDAGRELRLRQYWSFALVPRTAGTLRLPELRVAYFDLAEKRYAQATAPAVAVQVVDAPVRKPVPPPEVRRTVEPRPRSGRLPIAIATLLAAALLAAAIGTIARRVRARSARGREIDSTILAGDAKRLERDPERYADWLAPALRRALGARVLGAASASAEEILDRAPPAGPVRDAANLLVQLDAARFGARGPLPTIAEALAVIRSLEELPPLER